MKVHWNNVILRNSHFLGITIFAREHAASVAHIAFGVQTDLRQRCPSCLANGPIPAYPLPAPASSLFPTLSPIIDQLLDAAVSRSVFNKTTNICLDPSIDPTRSMGALMSYANIGILGSPAY